MKPGFLYDALWEWAIRSEADKPIMRIPGPGFNYDRIRSGKDLFKLSPGKHFTVEVYPADIIEFLRNLT